MIKIEKGIPVPLYRKISELSKILLLMEIGDSILVKGKTIANICTKTKCLTIKMKRKFTCRTEEDGVRVWRIE